MVARPIHLLALVMLAAGCVQAGGQMDEKPITGAQSYYLSKDQLVELETKANSGDQQAAMRLAGYYTFFSFNERKAEDWLRKPAEAGNAEAQYRLGIRLIQHQGIAAQDEGRQWLERAKANGSSDAASALVDLRSRAGDKRDTNR